MKMNWGKIIFHCEKWTFIPIENCVHTTVYLVLGKALLARLYLGVKLYIYITITNSVYNFTKDFVP